MNFWFNGAPADIWLAIISKNAPTVSCNYATYSCFLTTSGGICGETSFSSPKKSITPLHIGLDQTYSHQSFIRVENSLNIFKSCINRFGVERIVASPLPHRPVRAAFLHTVPPFTVSLKDYCDRFLVSPMASILPLAF